MMYGLETPEEQPTPKDTQTTVQLQRMICGIGISGEAYIIQTSKLQIPFKRLKI